MSEGGSLLGQGRFGCIFDTLPRCTDRARTARNGRFARVRDKTRRAVKIVEKGDPTIRSELEVSRSLRKIRGYEDYFVIVDETCIGDDITGDPDWKKCRLFDPSHKQMVSFVQLRMRYAGVRLSDYVRNVNYVLGNWLELQIHLFEGLRMFHKAGYVHGDLHLGNILVDVSGVPRIIDFGLAYDINKVKEKDVVNLSFIPKYDNYAPELDLIAGIRKGLDRHELCEIIYNEKHILQEIDELFPSRYSILEDMQNFANRINVATPYDVKKYIQLYGSGSDVWTLGYNLLRIYTIMITTPIVIDSAFYKQHHRDQMRLLRELLMVDPRRRLSAEDALTQLYSMRMSFSG